MNEPDRPSISDLMADRALINKAIGQGVRDAILQHARAGNPVATWQDGKVVWISAEEALARMDNKPAQ